MEYLPVTDIGREEIKKIIWIDDSKEPSALLRQAPQQIPVRHLDETLAARKPVLKWRQGENI